MKKITVTDEKIFHVCEAFDRKIYGFEDSHKDLRNTHVFTHSFRRKVVGIERRTTKMTFENENFVIKRVHYR